MKILVIQTYTIAREIEIPEGMPVEMAMGKFGTLPLTGREGAPVTTLADLAEASDALLTEVAEAITA
jgi:hypothetical protein